MCLPKWFCTGGGCQSLAGDDVWGFGNLRRWDLAGGSRLLGWVRGIWLCHPDHCDCSGWLWWISRCLFLPTTPCAFLLNWDAQKVRMTFPDRKLLFYQEYNNFVPLLKPPNKLSRKWVTGKQSMGHLVLAPVCLPLFPDHIRQTKSLVTCSFHPMLSSSSWAKQ